MSQNENKSLREMEGQEANLFCKVASTIRGVQDLIVEHWEVECQPKPDGVGWSQISKSNILQTKNQQQWISINKICSQPINICTKIKPEQLCKHSWCSPQHPSSLHLTWTQQGTCKIIMRRNQIPRYMCSGSVVCVCGFRVVCVALCCFVWVLVPFLSS